ncbi:MAG: hypothetical protein FIA91_05155 [Geobacter sp.]|nr:hypothetical protein [Geobacter sp.]
MTESVNLPGGTNTDNICIKCALCCDGSLFPKAALHPSDDVSFLNQMGVESFIEGDRHFFQLPCSALADKVCTLYHNRHRFRVCRRFKCKLLKQFLSAEISFDAALKVICEVFKRRQSIQKLKELFLPAVDTTIISLINAIRQSSYIEKHSFRSTYGQQLLDCVILEELLRSRFYLESRQRPEILHNARD